MTNKPISIFLTALLLWSNSTSTSFAQFCAGKKSPQTIPLSKQELYLLEKMPSDNSLLSERAGGCFTDCFLSPFGSEECDACRGSASKPIPEWSTTEKILWSLGGLVLTVGMIWLTGVLNKGNNCNSSSACADPYAYGGNPYGYYSDPYGNYYGGGYYGSVLKQNSLSPRLNLVRKR